MKEIALSQGRVALVDDCDFEELSKHKWYAVWITKSFYVMRKINNGNRPVTEYMHRQVIAAQSGDCVDHINHNGLDCRKSNLRICTQSQNLGNKKKYGITASKFKGVFWHKQRMKWRAQIKFNYRSIHLGLFTDEPTAARAYDTKAKELFGEFALLNFPKPVEAEQC